MPFKMLKYLVQLMDFHLTEHQTTVLPLVMPLVIYNGDHAYPYSMDLFDLFSLKNRQQAKETLVAPYTLIDLSQLDMRVIRDDSWLAILLNALKYGPSNASPKEIITLLEIPISVLAERMDIAYIKLVFFYLCEAKDRAFQHELQREFHTTLQPILGDNFMTSIADAYRQEGRQEGRHLAKLETAHEMLLKGLDEVMVAEITKLSLTEVHNAALKIKSEKQTHH